MRNIAALLTVIATIFVMSGKAQAVPMYYTFEGVVSFLGGSATEIASNQGISLGSNVTYTFIVNFDADGSYTFNNGTVNTLVDDSSYDFFYTDYVSGDALEQVDGGYWNAGYNIAENNVGYDCLSRTCGYLVGNSQDDLLRISSGSADASDWEVNDTMSGFNQAFDSNRGFSYLYANLTLTDISPVSVPEPSTLLLLGFGMLGLLAFRRRQLTTQA